MIIRRLFLSTDPNGGNPRLFDGNCHQANMQRDGCIKSKLIVLDNAPSRTLNLFLNVFLSHQIPWRNKTYNLTNTYGKRISHVEQSPL